MTLKALHDLKALYESASGGKLEIDDVLEFAFREKETGIPVGECFGKSGDRARLNAALIVALHNKAPALFAAMEALEECGAKWQAFREKPIIQDDDIHTITIHLDAMWARVNAALAALKQLGE